MDIKKQYYADLNPGFGARNELEYTVFYINAKGRRVNLGAGNRKLQFKTQKGAINTAMRFNLNPGTH